MAFVLPTITDNTPIRGSEGRQLVANDQYLNNEVLARPKVVRVTLGQAAGNGGVFAWQNPESQGIMVTRVVIRISTGQSGQTMDVGRTSSAGASADDVIDGVSIASPAELDNITNKGTNGSTSKRLNAPSTGAFHWITGTASGTPSALAGFVYIEYFLE